MAALRSLLTGHVIQGLWVFRYRHLSKSHQLIGNVNGGGMSPEEGADWLLFLMMGQGTCCVPGHMGGIIPALSLLFGNADSPSGALIQTEE